jgi:hypothetical protein
MTNLQQILSSSCRRTHPLDNLCGDVGRDRVALRAGAGAQGGRVTMAAVTGPVKRVSRRRVLWVGLVAAWIVVVAGLGAWSVRHDPATVPDQRDIVAAVGDLQRAVGVVFAAADGESRAAVLGALEIAPDCRVTPVRRGMAADRDITVYVRAGEARAALDAIAAGLPPGYRAEMAEGRAGTRLSLHADAGNFVGVDSDAVAADKTLTVRVSTGCRPRGSTEPDRADPAAGVAPDVLDRVLAALGAPRAPGATRAVQAVACPEGGGVAATYQVEGVAAPADLAERIRSVSAGGSPVRGDESAWVYRTGGDSVVVIPDEKRLTVSVSTAC